MAELDKQSILNGGRFLAKLRCGINRSIPVPLYYQIKEILLDSISMGNFLPGDILPKELDICAQCGLSRPTVRQALGELVADGYLYRIKDKGTFISHPKIEARYLNKIQSFNEEMRQKGVEPSTRVLDIELVERLPKVSSQLEIAPSDKMICLQRVRYADNLPVVALKTYIPYQPYSQLFEQDYINGSLYDYFRAIYGIRIVRVRRVLEAVNASKRDAVLLQTEVGRAILSSRTIAYSDLGAPVEYTVARHCGDRNRFEIELAAYN